MKCEAVQNQILMLPDPRELPPALRDHVQACAECQAWAQHAARLETVLEHLPAPPAPEQKKESMLGDLMQAEPVIYTMPAPAKAPSYGLLAVRFLRRNASYVGGLAAAVLVVIGIYAFWPRTETPTPFARTEKHPFLEKIVDHNVALSQAKTPAERLQVLNGVADTISANTRDVARIAPPAKLKEMAALYEQTVQEGMVKQADALPVNMDPAEKAKLLEPYAAKLNADAAATETLALAVPPGAQPSLKKMADSARKGENALREKARGLPAPAAGAGTPTAAAATSSLTAEDKVRLFEANSSLIDSLVRKGIEMASAGKQVERVEMCRMVSLALVNAIRPAAETQNTERVAELTSLLHSFVRQGFVPMLEEAKSNVTPESQEGKELRKLQGFAADDLARLKADIGKGEKIRENQQVKDAVKQLDELASVL
jgi:hypothetical protein